MCEIFDEERRIAKVDSLQEVIVMLLKKIGNIPQTILDLIEEQEDELCLQNWIGLAASVTSVEEFGKAIK